MPSSNECLCIITTIWLQLFLFREIAERVKRIKTEMEESYAEMDDCVTQINNCIELLMPKPDNFMFDTGSKDQNESEDEDTDLKSHGILDAKVKLTIDINLESKQGSHFKINDDNKAIFSNLKDQHALFANKFYPTVKKWLVTLTKAGENCESSFLKKVIDVKSNFDETEQKLKPFEHALALKGPMTCDDDGSDSDEDGDDFIEVQAKSGYEATVRAGKLIVSLTYILKRSKMSSSQFLLNRRSFARDRFLFKTIYLQSFGKYTKNS